MINIKAIIVEDEILSSEELEDIINENSEVIKVIDSFDNGLDALNFISKNEVDVIFLDINIPLLDGVNLARTINNFKTKPKIVFITAYKKYAVEAFELEAFDYVTKPYLDERIISTIKKLESSNSITETQQNKIDKIKIKTKNEIVILNEDDIYMCVANDKETNLYTGDKMYTIVECLSDVYEYLPKSKFFRTHRSYIVNLDKIKSVISAGNSTYKLTLEKENLEALVSRGNIKTFREIMKNTGK